MVGRCITTDGPLAGAGLQACLLVPLTTRDGKSVKVLLTFLQAFRERSLYRRRGDEEPRMSMDMTVRCLYLR